MSDAKLPEMICDLLQPERYEPVPTQVELIQTHASWVFIAGDFVYKIKKPVNFGFLDFSTLKKRYKYCREELRLNKRLAVDYYLAVEVVVRREDGYHFGGDCFIVDYAVVMRRLPEAYLMRRLLAEKQLTPDCFSTLAVRLATFYREAKIFTDGRFGTRRKVAFDVEENFSQTEPYINETIGERDYHKICDFSRRFLQEKHKLFVSRVRNGAVREGHGDLHMEHICLPPGEPVIFDCIEFNQRFRRLDVVNDLAFLAMDLEENNRFDLAAAFITAVRAELGELYEPDLLLFYKCYRAYVRGKVLSFLSGDVNLEAAARKQAREKAARYFQLASIYAGPAPSGLIMMAGLSGSGKSWLAQAIHNLWGIKWLRSDVIRKDLFGLTGQSAKAPFGQGIYNRKATRKTYRELARRAVDVLASESAVIVDATNLKQTDREFFYEAVKEISPRPLITLLVCRAPRPVLEENLKHRQKAGDVSDAGLEVAHRQRFESPTPEEIDLLRWVEINTGNDLLRQLYQMITAISAQ
jgi:aminoglycoside phosphotransferase family enzyme/gluconate kinase